MKMASENALCLIFLISVVLLTKIIKCQDSNDIGNLVQLPDGKIRGHILKSENGNDYYAFQEIPYAAPPVGENRFQLPKKPEPWTGILDTTKNSKICYQYIEANEKLIMSEDCLYINVYSPEKPGSHKLLPVLFWIHGGTLVNGTGAIEWFGPKYIMEHGVVVVTLNYRLGSLGFVGTDDGVIPLNLGLKDQRFAMEWVNRNIHLFGGNPDHVTIVGESAGSLSVGYHLIGPWTDDKQLFHAVIMQSGTPMSGILEPVAGEVSESAFELGKAIDAAFSSNDTKELLKLLLKADATDIIQTQIVGGVVIENDGPFSYQPFQSFLDGNYKKVPVLIGFNSEEWMVSLLATNETLESLDEDPSILLRPIINMSPENRTIAGNLLKQLYTKNTNFIQDIGAYVRYTSDEYFTTGICKQVELASEQVPYYLYQFSYKGYLGGQMAILPLLPPDVETVIHAEDIHYMWDSAGFNSDLSQFPEEDQLMLHRYVRLWTNFIKYYNPTAEQDPLLNNITWLPSEPSNLRYLNINATFEMRENPRVYQQVKEIKEKYMQSPYIAF